jgi:autophagy-related protein 18
VIRVFGLPDGDKKYEFRRGSYSARIWSIGFNLKSTLMAVSSDTETVHIFRLTGSGTGGGGGTATTRTNDWENGEDRYNGQAGAGGQGQIGNGGELTRAGYDQIVEQKRKENTS